MTDNESLPATPRRRHIVRLAAFAAFLLGMFYLVAVTRVIDVEDIRRTVAATGPAAPLTYVLVSSVLGAIFVPGPVLAAGSGVLFGPVLGLLVTLGATVGTAIITTLIGRRAGRQSARALLGEQRADRVDGLIRRRGLWAVVGQRFVPGISDALASYAFGAFGVPLWQMARRGLHRVGAAGVRLYRAGRVDRRSVVAAGICGHRDLVHDRDRRRVRHPPRFPALAWASSNSVRRTRYCPHNEG